MSISLNLQALMSVSLGLQARLGSHSSNFGLRGSKVPENVRFSAQEADEPPCKI